LQTSHRRQIFAAAFAVCALLLQTLAPVAISPPRGQAVHFAHTHHGGPGEHHRHAPPRPEMPSCPVCQALQSGGNSIPAPTLVPVVVYFDYVAPQLPRTIEAPAAPALPQARARAPPPSV
jgi:hypothetical protein